MRPNRQNKPRRIIHSIDELPVICDCADAGLLLRRNPEVIAKMAKDGGTTISISFLCSISSACGCMSGSLGQ